MKDVVVYTLSHAKALFELHMENQWFHIQAQGMFVKIGLIHTVHCVMVN
jgi:hypothetical protein